MVNVEADAVAGPPLARRASEAGLVYSLAYGDQPALICELVDWARTAGFTVVCAGKGTRYLPEYHVSTPETVWHHHGFTAEQSAGRLRTPAMTQHPGERPLRQRRARETLLRASIGEDHPGQAAADGEVH